MENVNVPNWEKGEYLSELSYLIQYGINDWDETKEGYTFWDSVYQDTTTPYNLLKHLDNSYTPEPVQPPVMWRKINKDNLCADRVAAINIETPELIFTGTLGWDRYDEVVLYLGNGQYMPHFTHYLPLSELLNLPIEA